MDRSYGTGSASPGSGRPADRLRGVTLPGAPEFSQVAAALMCRGDDIVLVKEWRDGAAIWSVPGGGVEPGELVAEALVREVAEETGLRLGPPGRLAFVVNTTTARFPSLVVLFFECNDWDGDIRPADPDGEVSEAALVSRAEALRLVTGSPGSPEQMDPVVAYLSGAPMPAIWSYRDGHPAPPSRPVRPL